MVKQLLILHRKTVQAVQIIEAIFPERIQYFFLPIITFSLEKPILTMMLYVIPNCQKFDFEVEDKQEIKRSY
jgi:hypothetical protein